MKDSVLITDVSICEVWEEMRAVLAGNNHDIRNYKKRVRGILVRLCNNALEDCKENFGGFYFQINYLCKKHKEFYNEKFKLQSIRRHTSKDSNATINDLKCDIRIIASLYCKFYRITLPEDIEGLLPKSVDVIPERMKVSTVLPLSCRCIVVYADNGYYKVELDLDGHNLPYPLVLNDEHFTYLEKILHEGMQLNLLEASVVSGRVVPKYVVVEPDFVLDISSIANCFTEYGHHPLSFIVNKMKRKPLSQPILLGNFAGSALDDIIHKSDETPYSVNDSIRSNFKEKALDFCTCPGFSAEDFVKCANNQASNIEQAVSVLFDEYDKQLALLEPTFICEALGIQGRIDLMTIDFKLLVEQKSGKNSFLEWKKAQHGSKMMPDTHYVQLLMYLGIMMYNFKKKSDDVDAKLLYSRYAPSEGLVNAGFARNTFLDVLKLRNKIVATEYIIAREGFGKVLPYITPAVLNENKLDSNFYHTYLLPQLVEVASPLQSLNSLEKAYFCRMATFSYLELMIGKVGKKEGAYNCFADLWNLPLEKKVEAGNIYLGLEIKKKEISSSFNGYDLITLSIPKQGDDFLPNFRAGDMVYLYSYPKGKEPDARKSILYSGFLLKVSSNELVVKLGDGQKNPNLLDYFSPCFALEHSGSDASSNAEMRGLLEFTTAPRSRKDLILAQREPQKDADAQLTTSYDKVLDELLLKIKQAKDYFLLVGPPGTGKTHRALRFIVQEELANPKGEILLISYTNRAVDEICSMLVDDLGVEFLRLGRPYNCDKRYLPYLVNSALDIENPKLEHLKEQLSSSRIVVSTVSHLMSRPNIFLLKQFSLAVIDEASQILEPDLIGILGSHMKNKNQCDIDKFVMVGDYKQLPAVVLQTPEESVIDNQILDDAGFTNCRMSLFQRLIYREKSLSRSDFIGVLNRQGRMHPEIAEFPNSMFYASEKLGIVPCDHQLENVLYSDDIPNGSKLTKLLATNRVLFFPSPANDNFTMSDKVNAYEAKLVADLLVSVAQLYGKNFLASRTVGIIVPYRNQIALIKREIEKKKLVVPECVDLDDVTIDTVERYQGSQRDVIIFSFTVQHIYQLEFLTSNNFVESFDDGARIIDPKLNVVMTRARKQLIMTGNVDVLSNNSVYKKLIEYMKKKKAFVECISNYR